MKKNLLLFGALAAAGMLAMPTSAETYRDSKAYVLDASLLQAQTSAAPKATKMKKAQTNLTFNNKYKLYRRPAGCFNSAFLNQGHWWKNNTYIGSPRVPMTFKNIDPEATANTTYQWAWGDNNGYGWDFNAKQTSTEKDFVAYMAPNSYIHSPQLTATDGDKVRMYQSGVLAQNYNTESQTPFYSNWIYAYVDIASSGYWEIGTAKNFTATGDSTYMYDRGEGVMVPSDQLDATLRVAGTENEFWFGKNSTFNACGAAFEKPETAYLLRNVYVLYRHDADNDMERKSILMCTEDAPLTVTVYKMNEIPAYDATKSVTPTLGEVVATGTANVSEYYEIPEASQGENDGLMVYPLSFTLKDAKGKEITPEIDFPIMIVVSGYGSDKIQNFEIPVSADFNDDGFGELGYLAKVDAQNKVTEIHGINNLLTTDGSTPAPLKTAPLICVDVLHPYLSYFENETDARRMIEKTFDAAGESATIKLISNETYNNWTKTVDGADVPDWVGLTLASAGKVGNEFTGNATFNVKALPSDVKYREANVKLAIPGSYVNYIVKQGVSGVEGVAKAEGKVAYAAGEDFVINADANGVAAIYGVGGQLLKKVNVTEGTSVIDGSNMPQGVYVVTVNGKTVKVVK